VVTVRVLIHCNGGPEIGVGHVVRSLALAEEARASGHEVTLAGDLCGDFVRRHLALVDAKVRPVPRGDATALAAAIAEAGPDVVHLDTYDPVDTAAVSADPVSLVSNIEDADFGRRPAGLVVDPNFGAETEPREGTPGTPVLLRGSRFAPLRADVVVRRGEWQLREEASHVLVVMGGADPRNLTPRVLDALAATDLPLHVTAITRDQPRVLSLGAMKVDLVAPADDLPALMAQQDLMVSAAGTTVWELCCLGVPTALVCAVENQRAGYHRVVGSGAAVGLGSDLDGVHPAGTTRLLKETLENAATRRSLARQAARIVDGFGAWRIVRAWEQLVDTPSAAPPAHAVDVRAATMDDAERLLRWRNDPDTRRSSRDQAEIGLDQHREWLAASLEREDRLLFVASDADGDVGTVRWDRVDDGGWEVSITVAPERRGQGLARPLLAAGERALAGTHAGAVARELHAAVHEANPASRRLFVADGYLLDAPADDAGFVRYRKVLVG
jgi:spore coat polysaccharide biosynthesis predicted glycosyltransferase SpsG/RimJ/RimL family protein N-acetyltransferase